MLRKLIVLFALVVAIAAVGADAASASGRITGLIYQNGSCGCRAPGALATLQYQPNGGGWISLCSVGADYQGAYQFGSNCGGPAPQFRYRVFGSWRDTSNHYRCGYSSEFLYQYIDVGGLYIFLNSC